MALADADVEKAGRHDCDDDRTQVLHNVDTARERHEADKHKEHNPDGHPFAHCFHFADFPDSLIKVCP